MSKRRRSSKVAQELPPCDGPKLQRFGNYGSPIEWLERLDTKQDGNLSSEGYVFRARIKDDEYAIKVFKFFDPRSRAFFWGPLLGKATPLKTVAYYTDPFYAECRAYGRIQWAIEKKKLRPDIAVKCHGFILLEEHDLQKLQGLDVDLELQNANYNDKQGSKGKLRARAIVKDLAPSDNGVNSRSLYRILRDIKSLNKQGIYNRDIRMDNFRDGKIVDFGSSWTTPHKLLEALNERAAWGHMHADKTQFDEMVEDEEIANPKGYRGMADEAYLLNLRPQRDSRRS